MSNTTPVTDATFSAEVLESDLPVVVDFWAPWCGPCRLVAPILDELSQEYAGRVKVVNLNSDENPVITASYGVVSIPTLNFYSGGELVRSVTGARPKQVLAKEFDALLAEVAAR
jgi:thioredoxin 1